MPSKKVFTSPKLTKTTLSEGRRRPRGRLLESRSKALLGKQVMSVAQLGELPWFDP